MIPPLGQHKDKYHSIPAERAAEMKDLCIQWEHPGLLMLDLDSAYDLEKARHRIDLLDDFMTTEYLITRSKSGHHHMYIALDENCDVPQKWRYVIQALLGSDPKHEIASQHDFDGHSWKSVLFETLEENVKVEEWRNKRGLTNSKHL